MSRGPGRRERFLLALLERVAVVRIKEVAEGPSEYKALWRAARTLDLPLRMGNVYRRGVDVRDRDRPKCDYSALWSAAEEVSVEMSLRTDNSTLTPGAAERLAVP